MANDSKKQGKGSSWAMVGDSMEGIKRLRPDMLKQNAGQETVATQKRGASSSTTPVASSTTKPTKRRQ
ncbi:hypothetical protein [Trinickia mobilis]|uniref:hypothetical protein n=1 Tax=Trinickia mobilis TaxID=2816356 RepID=UPI001A8C15FA|nr:hypothetical protein [Trinickia mobilis]